jgi:hypothetical protein
MATRTNKSIIGDFKGTIGPVVLSESYGIATARGKPRKRGKGKKSAKQRKHTDTFSRVNKYLQQATNIINLGYQKPKNPKMSPFNAAVSWHFNNALAADQTRDVLDMEKIKFSSPVKKTQKAWQPTLSVSETDRVTVTWKLNSSPHKDTHLDDEAVIVVHFYYRGKYKFISYEKEAIRSDLSFSKELPFITKGKDVHCYMFMVSADKKRVSETQYLGQIQVKG